MSTHDPAGTFGRSASSLRHTLRRETRAEHESVDREFAAMMGGASLSDYHRFIRINHACHAAMEPALIAGAMPALVPGWQEWTRRPDLDRDMAEMDLEPIAAPPFPSLAPDDVPAAVGTAYVLEGSRLGALYIERSFERSGLVDRWPGASLHYLRSGRRVGFQAFAEIIDGLGLSGKAEEQAVAAARDAFGFFMAVAAIERESSERRAYVA